MKGKTIEQWCEIVKQGNNGGYANAWLLSDLTTRRPAQPWVVFRAGEKE
jgi:hypothetical protein